MADNEHELFDFIQAATEELAREYKRIQRRTLQDPGTAGDEGEENWAALLREWLPPTYKVVTKGRILGHEGTAGPQVDVLVLHPNYPPFLVNKKLYLASGVLAAFECKLTLKAEHITKATQNSVAVKRLCVARQGSPYHELFSPLKYGLLAHAHVWDKARSAPLNHVSTGLDEADEAEVKHPRESLDLVCVANLATFAQWKMTHGKILGTRKLIAGSGFTNYVQTTSILQAFGLTSDIKWPDEGITPIGSFLCALLQQLAWEDPSLRGIARYFRLTGLSGAGMAALREWPLSVYSAETRHGVKKLAAATKADFTSRAWDEWCKVLP